MCFDCWREVPMDLKRAVRRTWRVYSGFTGLVQTDERRSARVAYQAARDAAIGSVP